jgi:UDP-glucose:(heptosyl)LPS alpha-1,3-glucosyltransferase
MVFSEALRSSVSSQFGIDAAEIAVERPGVDLDRFYPNRITRKPSAGSDRLRLLFVAHNFELKGLRPFLTAMASAPRDARPSATVVGAGPIGRFRRVASRRGIADRVTFTGAVPRSVVADLYRSHDALIHPTFYDPFSLVALEALASGIPVVTTRRNGASELMTSGREGLLLDDPRDTVDLVRAFEQLSDPAGRGRMSEGALATGRKHGGVEHFGRVISWLGLPARARPSDRIRP